MTVRSRKELIRELVPQVVPLVSKESTFTEFEVPGSKLHSKYHVYISPTANIYTLDEISFYDFSCTCHEKSDPSKFPPCKGNSSSENRCDTVCKHCIAAFIYRLSRKNIEVKIVDHSPDCHAVENALRLTNLGGVILRLSSNQGNGTVWMVGKKKESKTEKLTLGQRINLLRGEEEKGIE